MLRITFTPQDLAKTRIAATWGPLGETLHALTTLQQPHSRALFGAWRHEVHARSPARVHPASSLFQETVLDLFTVTGASSSVEEGIEALRAAPAERLRTELEGAVEARARYLRRTDPWAGVAWGDIAHVRADREELLVFLRNVHRVAVAPHWPRILPRLRAEQTAHALRLAQDGPEAMLTGLPPEFRWKPPTLEVGRGALTSTVDLEGRGLLLVPSAFCQTRPIPYTDPMDDQAPVLLFLPVIRGVSDVTALLTTSRHGIDGALSALLGRTRARTLHAIGDGPCTTGQLAERLSASLPTASEQASVLRQAGLIITTRRGSAVLHTLTPPRRRVAQRPSLPRLGAGGTRHRPAPRAWSARRAVRSARAEPASTASVGAPGVREPVRRSVGGIRRGCIVPVKRSVALRA
ncbi:ArsR/SmtB family transcription factor [Kitasatospora sp. NPDC091257]|uniref:ArsR/SmtB family transcription factor n=1 Tax=Kitasatospora sp. NPDC091257 TaxID=3364084 RepID=UPI00380A025C